MTYRMVHAPLAQLDRASDFGSEGWGFDSLRARQLTVGIHISEKAEDGVMKAKAVDFVSYSVTDMDKAEVFWRELLGLDVEVARGEPGTRGNGYMELDAGGVAIGLVAMPNTHPNGI